MAEHVSFFTAKVKPGKRGVVLRHFRKWDREQRRYAKGVLRSTVAVGREVPNEIRGVVYWDNSRNYYTNARRPGAGPVASGAGCAAERVAALVGRDARGADRPQSRQRDADGRYAGVGGDVRTGVKENDARSLPRDA